MKALIICSSFLLSGCMCGSGHLVKENQIITVSCSIAEVKEPTWNMRAVNANAGTVDKLRAALADLELSKGYIAQLKAVNSACL